MTVVNARSSRSPTTGRTRVTPQMTRPSRDDAWVLMCEWTESDSLRKHALGVEAAIRAYARKMDGDEELWAVTALVHDLDYERYPDLETGHPRIALRELERLGYPDQVIEAVAGHAEYLEVPRTTEMAKALFAVDEMSGFVTACALVRPTGIEGMKPKSVRKKIKAASFAAAVDRGQLERSADELGVEMNAHIETVIEALAEEADVLGIAAPGPAESGATPNDREETR